VQPKVYFLDMKYITSIFDYFRPTACELKNHLKNSGQTPEQFADMHGVSVVTVNQWLSGEKKIPFKISAHIDGSLYPMV